MKQLLGFSLSVLAVSTIGLSGCSEAPKGVSASIQEKIKSEFPNTQFTDFNQTEYGLIEAMTTTNIIYFDQDAKAAFIGEILDLETKTPVTIERRRQLKEFASIAGLAGGGSPATDAPSAPSAAPAAKAAPSAPQAAAPTKTVDLSVITDANYVTYNEGAGQILYVVSDFNCGFCKRLHDELVGVTDIEIREIPVRFLRDDSTIFGAHALCSDDEAKAASEIFGGKRSDITTCDEGTAAVDFNTSWASQNGMSGTPTLITEDGKVSSGYRELSQILAFVGS